MQSLQNTYLTMPWSALIYLCAVACAAWAGDARESRLVHIAQGPVRGYKDADSGVFFFQSIPYATMPTGPNRYKPALPPPTWMHTFEAVSSNIACPQIDTPALGFAKHNRQENCLIASVYIPDTKEKSLPVVVYVHGGALQIGSGNMFIPDKLVAENNIIAVTFNYRVGIHGFLCLGTEDVPGNAGMKDQVEALRWVKKNIANFGGNPDAVTLAGYSGGAAAVDLLMLSKSTDGLFNKVIPESGGNIGQWTIQSDPLENAKQFARYLNFTNVDDIHALERFYKTASFETLLSVPLFDNPNSTFGPSPCIERATKSGEAFLDQSPVDILKSGSYKKLPLLYGFAEMEGLLRIDLFDSWKQDMNKKFSDFLPADLKFKSNEQKENVAKQVKEFYFGNKPIGEDNVLGYIDFFTDVIFAFPMLRSVKYHVENGHDQIYLYDYTFVDENSTPVPFTNIKGAHHCAQTSAIFGMMPGLNITLTEIFFKMSTTVRKLWGNFIKTGNPIPEGSSLPPWLPVGSNWSPHMSLGNEIALRGSLLEHRMRFWDDIYSEYYRDPIPPPAPAPKQITTRSEL